MIDIIVIHQLSELVKLPNANCDGPDSTISLEGRNKKEMEYLKAIIGNQ